jgi:hypothetical protein
MGSRLRKIARQQMESVLQRSPVKFRRGRMSLKQRVKATIMVLLEQKKVIQEQQMQERMRQTLLEQENLTQEALQARKEAEEDAPSTIQAPEANRSA